MMKIHVYSIRNNIACMDFLCIKGLFLNQVKTIEQIFSLLVDKLTIFKNVR